MDLPIYCLVGIRPVKLIATESGGTDVLAYDWQTGTFQREMQYLTRVLMGDGEIDYLSEAEFEQYLVTLGQR